jgi:hypothetical protein
VIGDSAGGQPEVQAVDSWVVMDKWWTERPSERKFYRLIIEGTPIVILRDGDQWTIYEEGT